MRSLGAREGVMHEVLARDALPASEVVVVVVLARVGVTLLDLVPAVLILAWRRRRTPHATAKVSPDVALLSDKRGVI